MKANTNRACRFNFDSIADVSAAAGFRAGERTRGWGPGRGQLTSGLVEHGWDVTAVEPGPRMRDLLASKFDSRITLVGEPFEEYEPVGLFDTVWSANAFHWVDPAVSYAKAADIPEPDGRLVLVWTFTMATDAVQAQLNDQVFATDWPGVVGPRTEPRPPTPWSSRAPPNGSPAAGSPNPRCGGTRTGTGSRQSGTRTCNSPSATGERPPPLGAHRKSRDRTGTESSSRTSSSATRLVTPSDFSRIPRTISALESRPIRR